MNQFGAVVAILVLSLSVAVVSDAQQNKDANSSNPIKSLTLDQTLLTLPCPPGVEGCGPEPSSSFMVTVEVEPSKSDKYVHYRYSATAGKIIGDSTKVLWDLTNAPPGSYTISVQAVRKGSLLKGYRSGTVNIVSGICICDCFGCPVIQINATDRTISAGETVSASATINGGSQDNPLTLNWTTSVGEIVSGQATNAIRIRIPTSTTSKYLDVTLTVGGLDRRCACPNSQSATIKIRPENQR
jgi:hypothetical protein